jgi:hypothetical protein
MVRLQVKVYHRGGQGRMMAGMSFSHFWTRCQRGMTDRGI